MARNNKPPALAASQAKYADADYATEMYTKAVDRFVRNGTTTAVSTLRVPEWPLARWLRLR